MALQQIRFGDRLSGRLSLVLFALIVFLGVGCSPSAGRADVDASRAAQMIDDAYHLLSRISKAEDAKVVREGIEDAVAVLITPSQVAGGLLIGFSAGTGVLLLRDDKGEWSYPSFIDNTSVSLGLQVGGSSSESITLIYNRDGLERIMGGTVQWGAAVAGAIGGRGSGREAGSTGNPVKQNLEVFSVSGKGGYVGATVEGGTYSVKREWNHSYYGSDLATPEAIMVENRFRTDSGERLRKLLQGIR